MDSYRTSGRLDEAYYREVSRFAVSRKFIWFTRLYAVVLCILAIITLIVKQYFYVVLFLVFMVLFALAPMYYRRRYLRRSIKFLWEAYPEGFARMESFFTVEGVSIHNLSNNAQVVLPYRAIQAATETEHYFLLRSEANQMAVIYKDCLTPEQIDSFLPFMQERCPKLKIKRSKR